MDDSLFNQACVQVKSFNIPWKPGAIYPLEMAAFLAFCRENKVEYIIESGRGDTLYSTQILAQCGIPASSIDFKPHVVEGIQCVTGDSFSLIPQLCSGKKNIGLLIDGPKKMQAVNLAFAACIRYRIKVVALHNCYLHSSWGKAFKRRFPTAFHYEKRYSTWRGWKPWEKHVTQNYEQYSASEPKEAFRSLTRSTLVLALGRPRKTYLLSYKGILTDKHPLKLLKKFLAYS